MKQVINFLPLLQKVTKKSRMPNSMQSSVAILALRGSTGIRLLFFFSIVLTL
jgi:hypothetical protein